jgi:nitroreductase
VKRTCDQASQPALDGPSHLAWLRERRSVRRFQRRAVPRALVERLLDAAISAPSSTNRQPWRFDVVRGATKDALVHRVREATERLDQTIASGRHAAEWGAYGDFFHEPLDSAAVVVVPQVRTHADLVARFLSSAGADASEFALPGDMRPDRCGVAASVMALLLQARAEGLGATWMAGPMIARPAIEQLLEIRAPFEMLGAIAIGWPDEAPTAPPRRSAEKVTRWVG